MRRMITGKQAEQIKTNKEAIEELQNSALKLYKHKITFDLGTAGATLSQDDWTVIIVNNDSTNYSLTITQEINEALAYGETYNIIDPEKIIYPYTVCSFLDESTGVWSSQLFISEYQEDLIIGDMIGNNQVIIATAEDQDYQNLEGFEIIDTVTAL